MKVNRSDFERVEEYDEFPDLSWLETDYHFGNDGELVIEESCRYSQDDVGEYGTRQVLTWIEEDHNRLARYGTHWWMIGIRARIKLEIPMGDHWINHTVETPGLWGIESDSGEDYFEEVFCNECQVLERMLEKMGIEVVES